MEIKHGEFMMLPPPPDCCQVCATKHGLEMPHNRDSLYYQMWFQATYKRSPTWADAMLGCSPEMKQTVVQFLRAQMVDEAVIGQVDATEEGGGDG